MLENFAEKVKEITNALPSIKEIKNFNKETLATGISDYGHNNVSIINNENEICDKYYSWGWGKEDKKIYPGMISQTLPLNKKNNSQRNCCFF